MDTQNRSYRTSKIEENPLKGEGLATAAELKKAGFDLARVEKDKQCEFQVLIYQSDSFKLIYFKNFTPKKLKKNQFLQKKRGVKPLFN